MQCQPDLDVEDCLRIIQNCLNVELNKLQQSLEGEDPIPQLP